MSAKCVSLPKVPVLGCPKDTTVELVFVYSKQNADGTLVFLCKSTRPKDVGKAIYIVKWRGFSCCTIASSSGKKGPFFYYPLEKSDLRIAELAHPNRMLDPNHNALTVSI